MIARLDWKGQALEVDLSAGQPVAIPIDPHGPHPAFFAERPASATPLRNGQYVGDMKLGGSCNAEVVELAPHCHGTHTECIGHVQARRKTVQQTIYSGPVLARLVTVNCTPVSETDENYAAPQGAEEPLITRGELEDILRDSGTPGIEALLIRTSPNDDGKLARDYGSSGQYPVLSTEAMQWLSVQPLRHLLVDTPSLDRADDAGRMANHRIWWGIDATVPAGGIDAARRSVTEMIFVPDAIRDGLWWLNIELSPVVSDATPSRPVLYPAKVMPA